MFRNLIKPSKRLFSTELLEDMYQGVSAGYPAYPFPNSVVPSKSFLARDSNQNCLIIISNHPFTKAKVNNLFQLKSPAQISKKFYFNITCTQATDILDKAKVGLVLLNKGPPGGLSRRLEISPEEGGASMWRLNYLNKDLDEWEEQISLELSRRFRLKMEMYLTKVLPMAMGWAEEKTMDGEEKANGMYYFDAFADKNKLGF